MYQSGGDKCSTRLEGLVHHGAILVNVHLLDSQHYVQPAFVDVQNQGISNYMTNLSNYFSYLFQ